MLELHIYWNINVRTVRHDMNIGAADYKLKNVQPFYKPFIQISSEAREISIIRKWAIIYWGGKKWL